MTTYRITPPTPTTPTWTVEALDAPDCPRTVAECPTEMDALAVMIALATIDRVRRIEASLAPQPTLLDTFAMHALAGLADNDSDIATIASDAYRLADAMMKQRGAS